MMTPSVTMPSVPATAKTTALDGAASGGGFTAILQDIVAPGDGSPGFAMPPGTAPGGSGAAAAPPNGSASAAATRLGAKAGDAAALAGPKTLAALGEPVTAGDAVPAIRDGSAALNTRLDPRRAGESGAAATAASAPAAGDAAERASPPPSGAAAPAGGSGRIPQSPAPADAAGATDPSAPASESAAARPVRTLAPPDGSGAAIVAEAGQGRVGGQRQTIADAAPATPAHAAADRVVADMSGQAAGLAAATGALPQVHPTAAARSQPRTVGAASATLQTHRRAAADGTDGPADGGGASQNTGVRLDAAAPSMAAALGDAAATVPAAAVPALVGSAVAAAAPAAVPASAPAAALRGPASAAAAGTPGKPRPAASSVQQADGDPATPALIPAEALAGNPAVIGLADPAAAAAHPAAASAPGAATADAARSSVGAADGAAPADTPAPGGLPAAPTTGSAALWTAPSGKQAASPAAIAASGIDAATAPDKPVAAPGNPHPILAGAPGVVALQAAPAGASAAAAPADAGPAAQLAPALVQLAHAGGGQQLTLRLDPAELGRVDIRIERAADGTATVQVLVDRPETLKLLQADQPHLQQALDRAGLPQEGRSLSLSLSLPDPGGAYPGAGGFADGQSGGRQNRDLPQSAMQAAAAQTGWAAASDPSPTTGPVWRRAGINITA